jgi:hypothetical protein
MKTRTRLTSWLFGLSALAGLTCLGSCSSEYSYFTVDMKLNLPTTTLDNIGTCTLTIMNESLNPDYPVEIYTLKKGTDDRGNSIGCGSGMSNQNIGKLNYSAMRTSGTLTFLLQAFETDNKVAAKGTSQAFSMKPGQVQLVQLTAAAP